jgi:peptidoglycan/LPS O-acetylase OafA/YrhL
LKYRAEIDGLRALAVIPVILFHAGFEIFSGGFVGVDVFFVISGYLITTILIEDIENKRFSIINFYERRARRILPVLFFVMLLSSFFAWVLLPNEMLYKFGGGLIGVSLFVSNVVFWRQQGYFDETAELNPILHTWSLAVEEQYYVLFPIFLMLTWRFGKNRVFWMIVVLSAISLVLSEWGWRNKPTANFYLLPTRAWELFAGSIAAFIVQRNGVQKNDPLAFLGLAAIVLSIFFYDESTPFPSVYALVPVLGVVLLILYANKETLTAKLLSTKVFVSIGLVSYSAYLWHQPIFAYMRVYTNEVTIGYFVASILVIVTFVFSYCSWKFIEAPFRDRTLIKRYPMFAISLIALVAMFALGSASKKVTNGREYELARTLSQSQFVYFENMNERRFMEGRLIYPLDGVDSIVVGSSRVMQINSEIMGEEIQSFTVSGASIEDDIAFGLEALTKLNYRNIYIAADPWLINSFDDQNGYESVADLYRHWSELMSRNEQPHPFLTSRDHQTIDDTDGNVLNILRDTIYQQRSSIPTDGSADGSAKKAFDGSHIYNKRYANQTGDISLGFPRLLNYAMGNFEYDTQSIRNLEMFVSYLQSTGVNVNFIFSPYHPVNGF